jgi:DNA invertase Pin-like site-specific DNA recombinase
VLDSAARPNAGKVGLIYVRVSDPEKFKHGYTKDHQLDRLTGLAGSDGVSLPHPPIVEQGQGNDWDIEGLRRALAMAQERAYQVLYILDTSRLGRSLAKQLAFYKLFRDAQVELRFADQSFEDTAEGGLMRSMTGAIDEYNREKTNQKTFENRLFKVQKRGHVLGHGPTPWGRIRVRDPETRRTVSYDCDPSLHPYVRRIFLEAVCQSHGQIAEGLRRDGVPPPSNGCGEWRANTVRSIIRNHTYRGKYCFRRRIDLTDEGKRTYGWRPEHEWVVIDIPPDVTQAEWDAANQASTARRNSRGPSRFSPEDDPFALRKRIFCDEDGCGRWLAIASTVSWRGYTCLNAEASRAQMAGRDALCTFRGINAKVEAVVWTTLLDKVCDPKWRAQTIAALRDEATKEDLTDRQIRALEGEISKHTKRLQNLSLQQADVDYGSELWTAAQVNIDRTREELARLRRAVDGLQASRAARLTDDDVQAFDDLAQQLEDAREAAPRQQAGLYNILDLKVWVRQAGRDYPGALHIGHKYFHLRWEGRVPLLNFNSADGFQKPSALSQHQTIVLLYDSDQDVAVGER